MPFFSDIEARDGPREPIWSPFATIRDNVELLIAINLGWSLQLLPGVLALAFHELPYWLRILLALYSATVALPATGALYALSLAATQGEHLSAELVLHYLRHLAGPSFRRLTPLYGVFGVLIWLAVLGGPVVPAVATLATLASLLWYLCATYWGPLLVSDRDASTLSVATRSMQLVWRYPAETLMTGLVAGIALIIGLVSIAGLLLIVPVVIALLHAERFLQLSERDGPPTVGGERMAGLGHFECGRTQDLCLIGASEVTDTEPIDDELPTPTVERSHHPNVHGDQLDD